MKVKIISDGTRKGTRVVDAATGAVLERVMRIDWQLIGTEGVANAQIELLSVEVELEADANVSARSVAFKALQ